MRVVINLTDEAEAELNELSGYLELPMIQLMRRAFAIYRFLVFNIRQGDTLLIKRASGDFEKIIWEKGVMGYDE